MKTPLTIPFQWARRAATKMRNLPEISQNFHGSSKRNYDQRCNLENRELIQSELQSGISPKVCPDKPPGDFQNSNICPKYIRQMKFSSSPTLSRGFSAYIIGRPGKLVCCCLNVIKFEQYMNRCTSRLRPVKSWLIIQNPCNVICNNIMHGRSGMKIIAPNRASFFADVVRCKAI